MGRSSAYENREYGWRAKLRELVGRRRRPAPIPENPVWVQGTGAESGRLIGVLDEDGELVRFPDPPADQPETWPREWWQPVIGGDDPWS